MPNKIPDFMKEFDYDHSNDDFISVAKPQEEIDAAVKEKEFEMTKLCMKHKTDMELLENLMIPFLVRLYKSEEDYIHWPVKKRSVMLKEQIEKILKITRGE